MYNTHFHVPSLYRLILSVNSHLLEKQMLNVKIMIYLMAKSKFVVFLIANLPISVEPNSEFIEKY